MKRREKYISTYALRSKQLNFVPKIVRPTVKKDCPCDRELLLKILG
jgi:hypothetical protein